MKNQEIPKELFDGLDQVAKEYAKSPATTEAGRWIRFLARIIKPTLILKIVAHAFGKDIPVAPTQDDYRQLR